MIKYQRRLSKPYLSAWLTLHHVRKVAQDRERPSLADDPHGWLQEAAGSRALINQTDTRLGIDVGKGDYDLIVGGFARLLGPLKPPIRLKRIVDDDGVPQGYSVYAESLDPTSQAILDRLGDEFRYSEAKAAIGGNSHSNTADFLERCVSLGLVKKTGREKKTRYLRVRLPAE